LGINDIKIVARLFFSFITILAGIEAVPYLHEYLLSKGFDNSFGMVYLAYLDWNSIFNHAKSLPSGSVLGSFFTSYFYY